jgi:hypothetical protein
MFVRLAMLKYGAVNILANGAPANLVFAIFSSTKRLSYALNRFINRHKRHITKKPPVITPGTSYNICSIVRANLT